VSADDHWFFRPLRRVHRCRWQLPAHVEAMLRQHARAAHPRETGGLLLGWWQDRVPVVIDGIEVLDPDATRTRWTRHPAAAELALQAALDEHEPCVGYVGDWHSHPADQGPSGSDLRQLRQDSRDQPGALALAVIRHGGRADTRLALSGRLVTASDLRKAHNR
jgi:integrative and conjugative element protein (TIGR02256 family)